MTEQSGYRIHEWGGDLHQERFPRRQPGPGEVEVRVHACGVGLTVINCISGNLTTDTALLPRVPGHEISGTVESAGPGVDPSLVGRRVVAYFYLFCGTCVACLAGDEPRCRRLGGWVGTHRHGGYAPWTVLPARNVVPVPEEIEPVAVTVVPDAVATPVHVSMRRARLEPGDRVVVIGAGGGVGIHMVQMARLMGARVAGIDLTNEKLELIERHEATGVQGGDLESLDPGLWGGERPTAVIDFVGTAETLIWAARSLADGGRMVVVTTIRQGTLDLLPRELVFREIAVLGSRYARRSEVATAADLVNSGRIVPVIGTSVEPDGLPDLHAALTAGTLLGRGAVRWPTDLPASGGP